MKEKNLQLLEELDILNRKGVRITLEGLEVSPSRVMDEFVISEESDYMRDYILDENGKIIELGFYKISN